ncbi:hypothetical protein EON73_03590 [bacterium]|nr:MAG: hypothetical protein EON73_03590 [bacterium]
MRDQLKSFHSYFWGLTKADFESTSELIKTMMKAFYELSNKVELSNLEPHEINLYMFQHYQETQFIIQFGIWRLQSIFESLVKTEFDINTRMGLREIIKKVESQNYKIINKNELFEWSDLRNSLSHSAPETLHPDPIFFVEKDIDDFSKLLLNTFEDLLSQKALTN